MWVDTHAHLQLSPEEPEVLLSRAREVDWMVVPGIDVRSSREALELQARHPDRIVAAVGLHPHEARHWADQSEALKKLIGAAAAIGETGLDFYRDLSPRVDQLTAFREQAAWAQELHKPLIVHCRDAFAEVFEVIASLYDPGRCVMHCWTGGRRWTKRFGELGVVFSFAGPVTFPSASTVRAAAAQVPPGRALVETDTPYLTPSPQRHVPNEPANVALVGEALARVWERPTVVVAEDTSRAAAALFRP